MNECNNVSDLNPKNCTLFICIYIYVSEHMCVGNSDSLKNNSLSEWMSIVAIYVQYPLLAVDFYYKFHFDFERYVH